MKTAVLLVNLGTPSEPTPASIRRFLAEFLSDKRVIELPRLLWLPILYGFVLPFRPKKLVPKYEGIWLPEGSPLMVHSRVLCEKLQAIMPDVHVEIAMRYGEPHVRTALKRLSEEGYERILVMPMYAQYSAGTTGTIIDCVAQVLQSLRNQPEVRYVKRFYADEGFVHATVSKIKSLWDSEGVPDRLLLSYHGLPQSYIDLGDPYERDCQEGTALIREALAQYGVPVELAYQSQFGRAKWIGPSTGDVLKRYAVEGIARVDVHSPSFLADCIETLEEIQDDYAHQFLNQGGKQFRYIPCLNADDEWVQALANLVRQHSQGW